MFVRPEKWNLLSAAERREARFSSWMSTADKAFATAKAEQTYRRHSQRMADIIALKKPDRIPLLPLIGGFVHKYGGITPHQAMYDSRAFARAYTKFVEDFLPDYNMPDPGDSGRMLDLLDYKVYRWPGHGLPLTESFQMIEEEYMLADEYDQFIADPELFYLRVYMPRAFGALSAWRMLPSAFATMELPMMAAFLAPVGTPEVQQAFRALLDAGKQAYDWTRTIGEAETHLTESLGIPSLLAGFSKAPFDIIGDTLRGTRGIMLDLFRQPANVFAALERLVPIAIQMAVESADAQDTPFIFIPLHKGADEFMSSASFQKFYWPSYKTVLLGMIAEGLVPFQFVEGSYNRRLDIITDPDIPVGTTYWNFDRTDMLQVKKKLGGWACFSGNVPGSLLYTGTASEVEDYVKRLIDNVGRDGGYAMATGLVVDHALPENLHAMFKTCKEYGVDH